MVCGVDLECRSLFFSFSLPTCTEQCSESTYIHIASYTLEYSRQLIARVCRVPSNHHGGSNLLHGLQGLNPGKVSRETINLCLKERVEGAAGMTNWLRDDDYLPNERKTMNREIFFLFSFARDCRYCQVWREHPRYVLLVWRKYGEGPGKKKKLRTTKPHQCSKGSCVPVSKARVRHPAQF